MDCVTAMIIDVLISFSAIQICDLHIFSCKFKMLLMVESAAVKLFKTTPK